MSTVLSVNNYYYYRGGAETVFLEHNKLLAAAGWAVVPFAMQHPKNLPTPWSRNFIDEIELGSHYSVREKLVRVPKVVYSFEARRKMARLLDAVRPDICHAHNIYHHLSPSILGPLRQRGIPTVLTLHDLKLACPAYTMLTHDGICERCKGGRIHNVLVHRCIKGSLAMSTVAFAEAALQKLLRSYERTVSRFIVPSRFYIQKFIEWRMPPDAFVHVPNFVDVEKFTPDFQPGADFVYVGRLSREKGLATLVRASALVNAPLRLVGTGPELEALRTLAASLAAPVTFSGYLAGNALHDAIRAARAVVLASEWYENAPMSVLESYALGKPVLGARIGGIPELIVENETGLTFTSGHVEAAAQGMRTLLDASDSEVSALGRAARTLVEHNYTAEHYRQRIVEVYATLGVQAPP